MFPQDMIPPEKTSAVSRALREAFGVTEFEDISQLTKGRTTSLVFRIVVKGSPFLLKIIMRTDDPTCHFTCMTSAAEAGLAPRVRYTSIEDKISITDFVDTVPFAMPEALVRMPAVLRTLHALAPFPRRADHLNTSCMFLLTKGVALDGFIQMFRAKSFLADADCDELFARHAHLAVVYERHDSDMVSSHNDLFKPDNILFDGNRVWLVDWEAAFLNDRYADLAVVANMLVTNDAEEASFLQSYFGHAPDEYQFARFFLMRQVAHVFYTAAFVMSGFAGKPISLGEPAPTFAEFHRRFWTGEVAPVDNDSKIAYARFHWQQLLHNVQQPRFSEALRIVSSRTGSS